MAKISKKQRVALRQIDDLTSKRNRQRILAAVSIGIMVLLIIGYNLLTYELGIVPESNVVVRAGLYICAMVAAGYSGIMLMNSSKNSRKIDGLRQQVGISRETLEAWKRGEYAE